MPYKAKPAGKGKVKVVNVETGRVHAKATTPAKAKRQMNLMRGVEHGWKPTGKPARGKGKRK